MTSVAALRIFAEETRGHADEWRSLYQPAMQQVRAGERPWVKLDVLNRENLETILSRHGADFGAIPDAELVELNRAWEQLDPWPDAVIRLTRLKRRFAIGPPSNSHIAGMLNLARFGGLPWDVITGAEVVHRIVGPRSLDLPAGYERRWLHSSRRTKEQSRMLVSELKADGRVWGLRPVRSRGLQVCEVSYVGREFARRAIGFS